jgi:rhodanese-related sulfurtransferase
MSDLITPKELYEKLSSDQWPVIIDVRGVEAYRAGHIPGALLIPGDDLAARMPEIPKGRPVVAY